MSYQIKLDVFEGPLDLLLYLIRKNEIDIYNIPVALITRQYLGYLDAIRSLNLDLAGEYLVMAATLAHIKSRMLLPAVDEGGDEEEGEDPRAELVKQLLEYQAYKEAAGFLSGRPLLERDVFKLGASPEVLTERISREGEGLIEADLFELVEAFRRILAGIQIEQGLEFSTEKLSLAERMNEIMEILAAEGQISFSELVGDRFQTPPPGRKRIVYTFLALLELIKLRMATVCQAEPFGEIRLFLSVEEKGEAPGTEIGEA